MDTRRAEIEEAVRQLLNEMGMEVDEFVENLLSEEELDEYWPTVRDPYMKPTATTDGHEYADTMSDDPVLQQLGGPEQINRAWLTVKSMKEQGFDDTDIQKKTGYPMEVVSRLSHA